MAKIHFDGSGVIAAPPDVVWDILTDYHDGHPSILPKPYFSDFAVESGGQGAGTVMRFTFRVAGTTRHAHQRVSTPEPGRVLVESDVEGSGVTTFTLTPLDGGVRTQVDITTDLEGRRGLAGAIERVMVPPVARVMRRIYEQELHQLDERARQGHSLAENA